MTVEHKIATAKASSNKDDISLSGEAAILFYKTLSNQPLEILHLFLIVSLAGSHWQAEINFKKEKKKAATKEKKKKAAKEKKNSYWERD